MNYTMNYATQKWLKENLKFVTCLLSKNTALSESNGSLAQNVLYL